MFLKKAYSNSSAFLPLTWRFSTLKKGTIFISILFLLSNFIKIFYLPSHSSCSKSKDEHQKIFFMSFKSFRELY